MKNTLRLFGLISLTIALTACGGGSDSSGSKKSGNTNNSTPNNTSSTKITAQCTDQNNNVSITTAGCIFTSSSNAPQTAICESSKIKILSGSGFTATEVAQQGSSFNATGTLTINGKNLSCVA